MIRRWGRFPASHGRHRRRRGIAGAVCGLVAALTMGLSASAAEGDFIVSGGGWGHGVGMSQYGAQAMALDGAAAPGILGYYYTGSTLSDADSLGLPGWLFQPESLAVNVASRRTTLDIRVVVGSLEVCHRGDGEGGDDCSGAPDETIAAGTQLRVVGNGTLCTRSLLDGNGVPIADSDVEGACDLDLTFEDFSQPVPNQVRVEELTYARGPMEIRASEVMAGFDVVVMLGIEEYLYGIGEMPLGWEVDALQAQAITARSFGLATAADRGGTDGSGRLAECGCHLRRTPADQNYDAWIIEGAGSNGAKWRDDVVGATAGQILTHPDVGGGSEILTTFYSSSTGGWTENNEDVFGGPALPYLRSVEDPFSLDPQVSNPYTTWEKAISRSSVESRLGWDAVISMQLSAGPPGSVVEVAGIDNGSAVTHTWTGWNVRQIFDLRSPYIAAIQTEGPPPPPFTDIFGSVHEEDIGFIWREGITQGCNPPDNTLYCPARAVSREEMATLVVRALDVPASDVDAFVDDEDSVHRSAIDALAAAGITKGCNPPDNDRFCPSRPMSRGEMAAFLVRAFEYVDPGEGDLFIDDDSSVFAADIDRLAVAGVTKGCNPPTNDRFCPEDPVTRGQMASFLARALRNLVDSQ